MGDLTWQCPISSVSGKRDSFLFDFGQHCLGDLQPSEMAFLMEKQVYTAGYLNLWTEFSECGIDFIEVCLFFFKITKADRNIQIRSQ